MLLPDGDPGPVDALPYQDYRGRDLLVRQGQKIDPGELALHDVADLFRLEMRKPYPQCEWLQTASTSLMTSMIRWFESRPYRSVILTVWFLDLVSLLIWLALWWKPVRGSGIAMLDGPLASSICNSFFE